MGFLLGLFIGCSIFILGFLLGGGIGLYLTGRQLEQDENSTEVPKSLTLILPDFGDFLDDVIDAHEHHTPLMIQTDDLKVILVDASMHLDDCFSIDENS